MSGFSSRASPTNTSALTLSSLVIAGMVENLLDLGLTGAAYDRRHDLSELCGVGDPARGAALVETAVIDQLEVKAPNGSGGLEHLGLELAGGVPGCFSAGGGIEGEDEASTGTRARAL